MIAIQQGNTEIAEYLIDQGVDTATKFLKYTSNFLEI